MAGYDLQPNESFVHKHDRVIHGGRFAQATDELILTSRNIILIEKGTFGNKKGLRIYPLDQIKVFNGRAQAHVGQRFNGLPSLDVYFTTGSESFGFERKAEASFWAHAINELITGTPAAMTAPEATGPLTMAEQMRDVGDQFREAFGVTPKVRPTPAPPNAREATVATSPAGGRRSATPTAGDCNACGAPLSGMSGQVVICAYCDTANHL